MLLTAARLIASCGEKTWGKLQQSPFPRINNNLNGALSRLVSMSERSVAVVIR